MDVDVIGPVTMASTTTSEPAFAEKAAWRDTMKEEISVDLPLNSSEPCSLFRAGGSFGRGLSCYGFFSDRIFGVIGIAWILAGWPGCRRKC
jgi:hypothetical protein